MLEDVTRTLHKSQRNCFSVETELNLIPKLNVERIIINVTEFIDAGNFWVNTLEDETYMTKVEEIRDRLVYSAQYTEDNMYIFVDYGNIQQVIPQHLSLLPDIEKYKLPPLGVECVFQGIQVPSSIKAFCCYRNDPNRPYVKAIKQALIELEIADPAAESFLSKADHKSWSRSC